MRERITRNEISIVYQNAIKKKMLNREDSAVLFYDLTFLKERIEEVKKAFSSNALHTVAIKACPVVNVLKHIKEYGIGLEAASLPEVYLAEKSGYTDKKIVFDSPAKTKEELEYAISTNSHINADSLQELELIDQIITETKSKASFGLRINPQVGTGKILITSVAGDYSKFGVPIKEYRKQIIDAYLKYDWLTGIHLHVGSQGCPIDLFLKGIGVIYELAMEINTLLNEHKKKNQINIFDLGGGFPVSYKKEETSLSISDYAASIKENFPLLFTDTFKLYTEFGRYYYANTAFAISRIDNIKHQKGITTIVSHLGADFLIRRAYLPEQWHHDISVMAGSGKFNSNVEMENCVIAGPLCFAGDVIAKEILLPKAETGDYIIIHDVGAYTLSMWSRYNSRQMPKILGYFNNGEEFVLLKERETLEKVFQFWS
jgi:diaminopimelate decarboxylase